MQFTEKRLRVKRYGRPVVASRAMLVPDLADFGQGGWSPAARQCQNGKQPIAAANPPGIGMQRRGCRTILIGLGCW